MKIGLLCRNPELYSHRRLVEAAEERGHDIDVIDHLRCFIDIASNDPEVHYKGHSLTGYDAIIPRIGASMTGYGMAVLRQFTMMGAYCLNSAEAIGASRDKLYAHQVLAREGIAMPVTAFAHSPKDTNNLIARVGGGPVVVKLLQGTQGRGVVRAETKKAAESGIDAFRGLDANFIVQEFVKEAKGVDIRCFVIGGKVIGSMMRKGAPDDFRSNLHRGGSASLIRITPEERSTALRAAKTLGLNVAGVDLLRSNHGPVVMEVNSSPGLEGIEKATGIDIAGNPEFRAVGSLDEVEHHRPMPLLDHGDKLFQMLCPAGRDRIREFRVNVVALQRDIFDLHIAIGQSVP